jgi:hypothetical protein
VKINQNCMPLVNFTTQPDHGLICDLLWADPDEVFISSFIDPINQQTRYALGDMCI